MMYLGLLMDLEDLGAESKAMILDGEEGKGVVLSRLKSIGQVPFDGNI